MIIMDSTCGQTDTINLQVYPTKKIPIPFTGYKDALETIFKTIMEKANRYCPGLRFWHRDAYNETVRKLLYDIRPGFLDENDRISFSKNA
mgnify:CR=1 FL=1